MFNGSVPLLGGISQGFFNGLVALFGGNIPGLFTGCWCIAGGEALSAVDPPRRQPRLSPSFLKFKFTPATDCSQLALFLWLSANKILKAVPPAQLFSRQFDSVFQVQQCVKRSYFHPLKQIVILLISRDKKICLY